MRASRRRLQLLLASALVLQLAASPALAQTEISDPFERINRKFYGVSEAVDRALFGPLARTFGKTPGPVRRVIRNFTRNLKEPLVIVNDVLQGHVGTAASTLGRFVINSTIGIGGTMDVAGRTGIPYHENGFGTTLGRWGAGPGPYIFLPIMGPSNVRDAIGTVANFFINPLDYVHYDGDIAVGLTTGIVGGLDQRYEAQSQLDAIRATSTDPYATLRSYYSQNREAEIHGETEPTALPEFDMGPDNAAPAPAAPSTTEPQTSAPAEPAPAPDAAPAPAAPEAPPPAATAPKMLVEPDADRPLRTAGGK